LPLAPWLDGIRRQLGHSAWAELPTLFWLGASDAALHLVCGVGAASALLLTANVLAGPAALAAWGCYLSLFAAGRLFLGFQWDLLLLETGVIALLWAPWKLRAGACEPSSRVPLWLSRWLVFRLMLLSAFVKLASGDPSWRDLTAMSYHYETQPLPSWTSWYAHHLPLSVHRAETAAMFVIELVLPFLILAPRRARFAAFGGFVALQALIAATGNYGFFNLLTTVLCIALLDDACLASWLRHLRGSRAAQASAGRSVDRLGTQVRRITKATVACAGLVLFVLSAANFVGRVFGYDHVPASLRSLLAATDPFQLTSNYGLFAVMTKQRPEIVIEGSGDGENWQPYEFRWKPGDPTARPRFVQPHMPRLDWQMWFAALGSYQRNPWLLAFMQRLLEGAPPVRALLATDPFEGRTPLHVRALVYEYRFSKPGEPAWWTRNGPRLYAPVVSSQRASAERPR
jgi:hypothetical protein